MWMLLLALSQPAEARDLVWAGRTWFVRNDWGGPGPNHFTDEIERVWVDKYGRLHMVMFPYQDGWGAVEIIDRACTRYGEHKFEVLSPLNAIDPNIIVAFFLYRDDQHEIDIEIARWGNPDEPTAAQFVVQPSLPDRIRRFMIPTGEPSSFLIDWQPNAVRFRGPNEGHEEIIAVDGIPSQNDGLHLHINIWAMKGMAPTNGEPIELVLEPPELPKPRKCKKQHRLEYRKHGHDHGHRPDDPVVQTGGEEHRVPVNLEVAPEDPQP